MTKMTEQEWRQYKSENEDRLNDEYYEELDREIKKEHTYVDVDYCNSNTKGDKWIYMGNGNWTTNKNVEISVQVMK